jgi:hypothetical protein
MNWKEKEVARMHGIELRSLLDRSSQREFSATDHCIASTGDHYIHYQSGPDYYCNNSQVN